MEKKIIKNLFLIVGLLSSSAVINSCVREDEASITEPTRYQLGDIKSYADLFTVFWSTMEQRYNYFYEQKEIKGMDWNAIYKEYYPKFSALKHFGTGTDKEVQDDSDKAMDYFADIIDPIIDRHFQVQIYFPYSARGDYKSPIFSGGMKNGVRDNIMNYINDFSAKYSYMNTKISDQNKFDYNGFVLAGDLKSNPGIYYFGFSEFALTSNLKIDLLDQYLNPDPLSKILLKTNEIEAKANEMIKNTESRSKAIKVTENLLNEYNTFFESQEVKAFNSSIPEFTNTEVVSDVFLDTAQKALDKSRKLSAYRGFYSLSSGPYADLFSDFNADWSEIFNFINWFTNRMYEHSEVGYKLQQFNDAAQLVIDRSPFYKRFLNPLHKGEIKKIIIDLRGNGGGAVLDARFFSDRFITHNATAGYQRSKEGTGLYNYTPWVPIQVNPHKFGIPSNIPIAILTDRGSVSMSEISTLMWKSQGSQVVSIGDYSAGGTAGLGDPDSFNGGIRDQIAGGYITFYMPLLALKNAQGNVIEGIGIQPDIYVSPVTDVERKELNNSPNTYIDRVLNEAIKYLSSK
ncbi:Peptidase family S41 [Elizabethkingia miricola]|nr:Peptidase family S41 [Elizabethkingia miricola]